MPRILIMPSLREAMASADDATLAMTYREVPEGSPLLVECTACNAARGEDCHNTITGEPRSNVHSGRVIANAFANERTSDLDPIEPAVPADGPLSIICPSCFRSPGRGCVNLATSLPRDTIHLTRVESTSTCVECGEYGHTHDYCPTLAYCNNCDVRGHEETDCPVGSDDDLYAEEPEYDQADYCDCLNCVAASQYVPGVE